MTPEFNYYCSHCPVWNNFETEKQRSACFKRKAKAFSPDHLQSRWAATNAKGPYVKPCGWLWALPKPWSLCWHPDLHLQPRLSGPFLHSRPKKQNCLEQSKRTDHGVSGKEWRKAWQSWGFRGKGRIRWSQFHSHPFSKSSFLPRQFQSTSKHHAKSLERLQTPNLLWVGRAAVSPVCVSPITKEHYWNFPHAHPYDVPGIIPRALHTMQWHVHTNTELLLLFSDVLWQPRAQNSHRHVYKHSALLQFK